MEDILYEDDSILVVRKPAGVESQRGRSFSMDMESHLRNYLSSRYGIRDPYLAVIHRLDRPVSGIMVYAKNRKAAADLSEQLKNGGFTKIYEALVCGEQPETSGRLEDMLREEKGLASVALPGDSRGKKAVLNYWRITMEEAAAADMFRQYLNALSQEEKNKASIIRIKLETGRHHQIRVQTKHAGFPVAGDTKYSGADLGVQFRGRIALCAVMLGFKHPVTGRAMKFLWDKERDQYEKSC